MIFGPHWVDDGATPPRNLVEALMQTRYIEFV